MRRARARSSGDRCRRCRPRRPARSPSPRPPRRRRRRPRRRRSRGPSPARRAAAAVPRARAASRADTRRRESSNGPYTEYSRSVLAGSRRRSARWRQYSVAAALATAYVAVGLGRSRSSGAWSLKPYSEEEPAWTNASQPAAPRPRRARPSRAGWLRRSARVRLPRVRAVGGEVEDPLGRDLVEQPRRPAWRAPAPRRGWPRARRRPVRRSRAPPGTAAGVHLVAVAQQPPNEVRPDESGGAGHERASHDRLTRSRSP